MDQKIIGLIKAEPLAKDIEIEASCSFLSVETGGVGIDDETHKIIIRFEESKFHTRNPRANVSGRWYSNSHHNQSEEWIAFNSAFAIDKQEAMKCTSIGLGQIMGWNYSALGYRSVDDMWDDAKKGLDRQVYQFFKFVSVDHNGNLKKAIQEKNWALAATYYNGAGFRELAKKYNRTPYDQSLSQAYARYKKQGL